MCIHIMKYNNIILNFRNVYLFIIYLWSQNNREWVSDLDKINIRLEIKYLKNNY